MYKYHPSPIIRVAPLSYASHHSVSCFSSPLKPNYKLLYLVVSGLCFPRRYPTHPSGANQVVPLHILIQVYYQHIYEHLVALSYYLITVPLAIFTTSDVPLSTLSPYFVATTHMSCYSLGKDYHNFILTYYSFQDYLCEIKQILSSYGYRKYFYHLTKSLLLLFSYLPRFAGPALQLRYFTSW